MIEYLSDDPWRRRELMIQWMYQLFASHLRSDQIGCDDETFFLNGFDLYNEAIVGVIRAMMKKRREESEMGDEGSVAGVSLETETVKKTLLFFVREAPLLPRALFVLLEEISTQKSTFDFIFYFYFLFLFFIFIFFIFFYFFLFFFIFFYFFLFF
jgi:hypothetical protein